MKHYYNNLIYPFISVIHQEIIDKHFSVQDIKIFLRINFFLLFLILNYFPTAT